MDLSQLLKGKRASAFGCRELMNKAHWRWDRAQTWEAFLLFDAARARALEEHDQNTSEAARNRAAVTLYRSGRDFPEARERLEAVLAYYQAHPDRTYDQHFVEHAAMALLERAYEDDPDQFGDAFCRLAERLASCGWREFPWMFPHCEKVAEMAHATEQVAILSGVLGRLSQRKPMPRALRQQIRTWRAWLGE